MRILVVEDHAVLAREVATGLRRDGLAVDIARDGEEAIEKTDVNDYDVVVLDRDLPKVHGDDVCRRLASQPDGPRIIMLTAAGSLGDIVDGLNLGADDYLSKPFRLAELLARLKAQLRIFENSEHIVLTIGPYHFRPGTRTLHDRAKNRRIRLTEKEAAILKFLFRAGARPIARQVLLN